MLPASGQLSLQLHPCMRAVWRDDEQAGVAPPEEVVVEALAVNDDVGEPAPVDVSCFNVTLEANHTPGETPRGVRRGFRSEALDGLGGVMRLWRVDAEQADGVGRAVAERDNHGVAVDRFDHASLRLRRAPLVTQPPPRARGHDDEKECDSAEGTAHARPDTAESAGDGEELPGPRHAFELMLPAVSEPEL
jgi:hypothetical protein